MCVCVCVCLSLYLSLGLGLSQLMSWQLGARPWIDRRCPTGTSQPHVLCQRGPVNASPVEYGVLWPVPAPCRRQLSRVEADADAMTEAPTAASHQANESDIAANLNPLLTPGHLPYCVLFSLWVLLGYQSCHVCSLPATPPSPPIWWVVRWVNARPAFPLDLVNFP